MKKLLLITLFTAASTFAQGRFYVGGSWGYAPPPVRAYAPPPPPAYGYGYASRPPCPGPNYVWIDGFYGYGGNRYAWTPGYWAPRPHPRAYWVAPRYYGGNFYHGHWRR